MKNLFKLTLLLSALVSNLVAHDAPVVSSEVKPTEVAMQEKTTEVTGTPVEEETSLVDQELAATTDDMEVAGPEMEVAGSEVVTEEAEVNAPATKKVIAVSPEMTLEEDMDEFC